jgi:hypothetical protein
MRQSERTLQEYHTALPASEVITLAKQWFAKRNGVYAAFVEKEGPTYVTLRGQGGEEIALGTAPKGNGTLVTGSSYLFDMQIARFFATLPPFALVERLLGESAELGAKEAR